jgi:hypothetical protein
MNVFPRAFVRKRVISLAATALVAATSLALAHRPTSCGRRAIATLGGFADAAGGGPTANVTFVD